MTESKKSTVFISYSRKNKAFVRKLDAALEEQGINAWVDWEGIPLSTDWMVEIAKGIVAADAFLFVISPDALESEYCLKELELAISENKKIIPIVYSEPEKRKKIHPRLASANWVFLRPKKEKFIDVIPKIIETIFTDFNWVSEHTRLLQRAIEWDKNNRNVSYLLQGTELENAEKWMTESTTDIKRQVTLLQAEYIRASREGTSRRQKRLTFTIGFAMLVSILLFIFSVSQWRQSIENMHLAQENALIAAANERIAKEQQLVAEENARLVLENENKVKAQRSTALALAYSERPSNLDISTLLALESLTRFESDEAKAILRNNISKMPIPVAQLHHTDRIWNLILSNDGQYFISASADDSACVWTVSGEKKFCVTHTDDVTDVLTTKDDALLITAGRDGYVKFWNFSDGSAVNEFNVKSPIYDIDINVQNSLLIAGREDGFVSVINLKSNIPTYTFDFNRGAVTTVKFHPNGIWASVGTKEGRVRVWRVQTGQLESGPRHEAEVFNLAISPNGKVMVSVGADSTARIARAESGKETHILKHPDWVEDVAFSPNGLWFATASDDKIIRVFDTETGIEKLRMYHSSFVQRVKISPDGNWIVSTGYDLTARIWDSRTGALVLEASLDGIGSALLFSQDGKHIIVGDRDGNITIWDISILYSQIGHIEFEEFVNRIKFDLDGSRILINSDDKLVWQLPYSQITLTNQGETGKPVFSTNNLTSLLEISPNSKWIAVSENSELNQSQAILFNFESLVKNALPHTSDLTSLSFNPTNQFLVTTNIDSHEVYIWDIETGNKIKTITFDEEVFTATFNPKDSTVAIGLSDKIIIWNISADQEIMRLFHTGHINILAFNMQGSLLASASSDGSINIWDLNQKEVSNSKYKFNQNSTITALDFSSNKNWLASASEDGFVYLFDINIGEEILRIPHGDAVTGLDFSPDEMLLATATRKTLQIFDLNLLSPISNNDLSHTACSRLTRNLTQSEWNSFFPQEDYQILCPDLP